MKTIRQEEKLEIYHGPGPHWQETRSIFTWAARSFTYWKYTDKASNMASDEDIMENDYMFVMFSNVSVISHWIFPQWLLWFLVQNLKID